MVVSAVRSQMVSLIRPGVVVSPSRVVGVSLPADLNPCCVQMEWAKAGHKHPRYFCLQVDIAFENEKQLLVGMKGDIQSRSYLGVGPRH